MKWLKRLLHLAAFALLAIIIFCLVGIHLYRGTPSWYRRHQATVAQVKEAANSADQKLIDLFSWAAAAHAQQLRRLAGHSSPGESPPGPKTVTFNEDELNAFMISWKTPEKTELQQRISRYFTDGRVVFEPDAIILAGQSPMLGTLISAEFDPAIDPDGRVRLPLGSLNAGRLPIPQSAISTQLDRLHALLEQQLAAEQPTATIDPALCANSSALAACWLKLVLSALDDGPADSVLIIPFDMSDLRRGLPVKLTAIQVTEGSITLTLQPVSVDERSQLVNRLKGPWRPPVQ
jgi:hypothetical protein